MLFFVLLFIFNRQLGLPRFPRGWLIFPVDVVSLSVFLFPVALRVPVFRHVNLMFFSSGICATYQMSTGVEGKVLMVY